MESTRKHNKMAICKKCGKSFSKKGHKGTTWCNDCWLSRGKKHMVYNPREVTKVKICIKCGRENLIWAKGLCGSCYQVSRKKIRENKK